MMKKKKRAAYRRPQELPGTPPIGKHEGGAPVYQPVYVCGPMRNYPRFNFAAFDRAVRTLTRRGYAVFSPADMDRAMGFDPSKPDPDFNMHLAIRRDMDAILKSKAVVCLPGWRKSVGARAEREIARWADIPCYEYRTFRRIHK